MARGPVITKAEGIKIGEIYAKCPAFTAKEVLNELHKQSGKRWPGLSAVQKKLQSIRKRQREKEEELGGKDRGLDAHWSLGVLIRPGKPSEVNTNRWEMPPEANSDLLKIWKQCVIAGRPFTVREAMWAVRLRGILPGDLKLLPYFAFAYAMREKVCELLGEEETYTTDLDAGLEFLVRSGHPKYWLFDTARRTGALPLDTPDKIEHLENTMISQNERADMAFLWATYLKEESSIGLKVSPGLSLGNEEASMVYALWLRELAKGPKWQNMSKEAKESIVERLSEEVRRALSAFPELNMDNWLDQLPKCRWIPSRELFIEVGIDNPDEKYNVQKDALASGQLVI